GCSTSSKARCSSPPSASTCSVAGALSRKSFHSNGRTSAMNFMRAANASLRCVLFVCVVCGVVGAQSNNLAPGAPGGDAQWASAGKDGVGTANTLDSKVWFTLREGIMTEVYYPTVDVANVQELQFVVVTSGGKVETESDDATHRIEVLDPRALTFR